MALTAELGEGGRGRRYVQLHTEHRVGSGQTARFTHCPLILLLWRALSRHHLHGPGERRRARWLDLPGDRQVDLTLHHLHGSDASQASVLRVQHDLSVLHHHAHCAARLLHPEQLRREGFDGHHDAVVDDRVPDAGRRKHAAHVRRSAACR